MNRLKEKYYIALGSLQNMAIDNTKGSKGVDICVSGINEYVAYLQSKIDKVSEYVDKIYDVMDYKDYPPYLDEIYYTLHHELKEDRDETNNNN